MYILECFGDNTGFGKDYAFFVFRKKKTIGELINYLDDNCGFFKLEYLDKTPIEKILNDTFTEFGWRANPYITVNFKELEFAD